MIDLGNDCATFDLPAGDVQVDDVKIYLDETLYSLAGRVSPVMIPQFEMG